jgi:hypothetical protein
VPGTTMAEIGAGAPVATAHIEKLTAAQKAAAAAWREYNSAVGTAADTVAAMDGATVEGIKYDLARGISKQTLAHIYTGTTKEQIDAIEDVMKAERKAATEFAALQEKVHHVEFGGKDIVGPLGGSIVAVDPAKDLKPALEGFEQLRKAQEQYHDLVDKRTLSHYDYERAQVVRWVADQRAAFKGAADQAGGYYETIDQIAAEKLALLAQEQTQTLAELTASWDTWANRVRDVIGSIPNLLKASFTGGGGIGGFAQAFSTQIGESLIGKGVTSGLTSLFNKGATGLLNLFGPKLTAAIGRIIPGLGDAIGAIAGALMTKLFALFDHVPSDLRKLAHGYGVTLSDEVLKGIRASMKDLHLTEQAATIFHAKDLFPTVDSSNFQQAVNITHDAFSMIETHQLTIAQGAQVLDEMWPKLAAAGTDAYGFIGDKLKELIQLNERFGTQSKAIAEFLKQQAGKALDAFNDIAAVGGKTKDELADMGLIAVTSFNAAIQSGMSFMEALTKIHGGLESLRKAYADLGVPIDDPLLKTLTILDAVSTKAPALLKGIGGLGGSVVSLSNLGMLNPETFAALQRTGASMYTRLQGEVAGEGGSTKDALLPMQDWLHQMQMAAEKNHLAIDENTKRMIDQSRELGIWKEAEKTENEKLIDSQTALGKATQDLAAVMRAWISGGPLPAAPGSDTAPGTGGAPGGTVGPEPGTTGGKQPPIVKEPIPRYGRAPEAVHAGGFVETGKILRFHTGGLAPDEMVAILQTGEAVLRKEAVAALGASAVAGLNAGRIDDATFGGLRGGGMSAADLRAAGNQLLAQQGPASAPSGPVYLTLHIQAAPGDLQDPDKLAQVTNEMLRRNLRNVRTAIEHIAKQAAA